MGSHGTGKVLAVNPMAGIIGYLKKESMKNTITVGCDYYGYGL
jgi:hypothetical protein